MTDAGTDTDRLVAEAHARLNALKDLLVTQGHPRDGAASARPPGLPMLAAVEVLAQSTLADAQSAARRRTHEAESLAERIRSGQVRPGQLSRPGTSTQTRVSLGRTVQQTPPAATVFPTVEVPRPTDSVDPMFWDRRRAAQIPARPARLSVSAEQLTTIAGIGLVAFALLVAGLVVFLVGLTGTSHERSQHALYVTFRHQAGFGRAPTGGIIRVGSPVALVQIPRLHLKEVIVEGTSSAELAKGPGHLRTSPLPGQLGNAVLIGRRSLYGGPFADIGSLRPGDQLLTTSAQGKATYSVSKVDHVHSGGNDVIDATGDNRLTLVTSDPAWLPSQRLAVTAILQTTPHAAPPGRPTLLNANETGTRGDNLAASSLLAWALLLLGVAMGATWLYLRWAIWPTWLLTTPVLLALLYLFYESMTRLMPATL